MKLCAYSQIRCLRRHARAHRISMLMKTSKLTQIRAALKRISPAFACDQSKVGTLFSA